MSELELSSNRDQMSFNERLSCITEEAMSLLRKNAELMLELQSKYHAAIHERDEALKKIDELQLEDGK